MSIDISTKIEALQPITVKEILESYGLFGIPHFQRGFLWGDGYKSYLLESLYHGTPCGTLFFWSPPDSGDIIKFGTPLMNEITPKYLIIDGQQRIRSLWETLGNIEKTNEELTKQIEKVYTSSTAALAEDDEDADESDEQDNNSRDSFWCINLAALDNPDIREITKDLEIPEKDQNRPLFLKRRILLNHNKSLILRKNYIPLSLILCGQPKNEVIVKLIKLKNGFNEEVINRLINPVMNLLIRSFNINLITTDYQKAIDSYVRINNSGVRVSAEEKVFAKLVAFYPDTNRALSKLFSTLQNQNSNKSGDVSRDDYLARKRESSFGFKLFIRIFTQVVQYHFGFATGSDSISYAVYDSSAFRRMQRNAKDEIFSFLWDETEKVITCMRSVLEDELLLDDFRFLPDVTSLLPVFQLLIQYTSLRNAEAKKMLAFLSYIFLLQNKPMRDTLAFVRDIKDPAWTFKNFWEKFENGTNINKKYLMKQLEEANSLNNRFVLLMYILLRSKKARDFSDKNIDAYNAASEIDNTRIRESEPNLISRLIIPEKQHLIPYSWYKEYLGDKARRSSAPINNIGNLTYISEFLNRGIKNNPLSPKYDEKNWDNHCISKKSVMKYKKALKSHTNKEELFSGKKNTFDKFLVERRQEICNGFLEKLEELRASAASYIKSSKDDATRLEIDNPPKYIDNIDVIQQIRNLTQSHNQVEDGLIKLVQKAGYRLVRESFSSGYLELANKKYPIRFRITSEKVMIVKQTKAEDINLEFNLTQADDIMGEINLLLESK